MRLLICTQAVDQHDSVLGFFVRWIEEFAKHCEQVTVICLRTGSYELPDNVRVYALGEGNKLTRALKLVRLAYSLRNEYTSVFVHMNPEYLVAAGWLWRMLGKKITLWYVHKQVNLKLRIATMYAHVVATASKESFRLTSSKVRVVGHGIDTDFFHPDTARAREDWLLSVGRLTKSKRHDLAIRIAHEENKELRIAGAGPEREALEQLARQLGVHVQFLGGLTQPQLREVYQAAGRLIHTSETGSLDKVVLEAVACGLPVQTNDPGLQYLQRVDPEYVREHHSLSALIPNILKTFP